MHGEHKCMEKTNAWRTQMHGENKCMENTNAWRKQMHGEHKCMEKTNAWRTQNLMLTRHFLSTVLCIVIPLAIVRSMATRGMSNST
ncbi:hypothetical protein B0O80DRAFT_432432 [Mortierella sp. GBAus27b]|nr:hypothetical protein B0O80DRAFT_432432 [Mortierella sp. GBAus27b]